jgi:hypothetical protein
MEDYVEFLRIHRAQTAILEWLKSLGHLVDIAPSPRKQRDPQAWQSDAWRNGGIVPPERATGPLQTQPMLHDAVGKDCPYCGRAMDRYGPRRVSRDHLIPRIRRTVEGTRTFGEPGGPSGILIVCQKCNGEKSHLTLPEFAVALEKNGDERHARVNRLLETLTPP